MSLFYFMIAPGLVLFCFVACMVYIRLRNESSRSGKQKTIGFFHPYCNAGGGGERVLWTAVQAVLESHPEYHVIVYTGGNQQDIMSVLASTNKHFNLNIAGSVEFVLLKKRHWVEDQRYPFFTLLGQSLGSVVLGLEALLARTAPNVFVDSMGYAFTFPLFKYLGGSKVICYVHYPTISTDMLEMVKSKSESYNNKGVISKSPILTRGKILYYNIFAWLYGLVGSRADAVMTNSSWTKNHIDTIWKVPKITSRVYPPCDTSTLQEIPFGKREDLIISIAQFRPEKNHALQLESFKFLLKKHPQVRLALIGSCRHEDDKARVDQLKKMSRDLGIENSVDFVVNASFESLKNYLSRTKIGLHTMLNEHFGISVVEYMASGLIPVAHNSAGPQMDIVVDFKGGRVGYLASTAKEYCDSMSEILSFSPSQLLDLQKRARDAASSKFSSESFKSGFLKACNL